MSDPGTKKQPASNLGFVPVNVNSPLWEPYRAASYLIYDYPQDGKDHTHFRHGAQLASHPFRASGSHQLDAGQLTDILKAKVVAPFKPARLYVVDLRQETHAFFDTRAVSWYADNDFGNVGQPLAWIEADEAAQLAKVKAAPTTQVFSYEKDPADDRKQDRVTRAASAGFRSLKRRPKRWS